MNNLSYIVIAGTGVMCMCLLACSDVRTSETRVQTPASPPETGDADIRRAAVGSDWQEFDTGPANVRDGAAAQSATPSLESVNKLVQKAMADFSTKGIESPRHERLATAVESAMRGVMMNDFESYNTYLQKHDGVLGPVAEAVVSKFRELSFRSDDHACWQNGTLEEKMRRVCSQPRLRRARCSSIDLATLEVGTEFGKSASPLAKSPGNAFFTVYDFPDRVVLTNDAQAREAPCVWVSFECCYLVEHGLMAPPDERLLEGKDINEKMLVTIYFVESISKQAWMPFLVVVNGAQARPRLLL